MASTLTTDKGKTFDVNWAWAPVGDDDDMILELTREERSMAEIAEDFDGVEHFHKSNENAPPYEADYDGYTKIKSISRNFRKHTVQITLSKDDKSEE